MTWPIAFALAAMLAIAVAGYLGALWLNIRAQKAIRDEQRDERDTGTVAVLRGKFDRLEAEFKALETNTKLFIANNRR